MADTPLLNLPLLAAAQAQKHVTHNEALSLIDGMVHLSVADRDLTDPPAGQPDGTRYIVAGGATGAWAGQDLKIAIVVDGGWRFLTPRTGWIALVADEARLVIWTGAAWADLLGTLASFYAGVILKLGVNTAADDTNRIAVKSDAALFSHDDVTPGSGDMRIAVNKSAVGNDAAFVFQGGFSTRALLGLLGDDDLTLKVSPNGVAFETALIARAASGLLDIPKAPKFAAFINFDQYVAANAWTKIGINNARHNDQNAFSAGNNRFKAPAAGYYLFGAKYRFKANATVPTSIRIGFGLNDAAPAAGDDESGMHGTIVSQVSCVQHTQLYKLSADDTVDVRAFMATNDGYCESGHVSFWGHRVA